MAPFRPDLYNVNGGIMFKVFVGRDDEKRELLADQLAKFRALAERVGAKAKAKA